MALLFFWIPFKCISQGLAPKSLPKSFYEEFELPNPIDISLETDISPTPTPYWNTEKLSQGFNRWNKKFSARFILPSLIAIALSTGWVIFKPDPQTQHLEIFKSDFQDGHLAALTGNFSTALLKWVPLAESGDKYAQFNLGQLYYKGHGVPKDYTEAFKWYMLAAKQGDPASQYKIFEMYLEGHGTDVNGAEAVNWYNLSTAQGDARSLSYDILYYYENGEYQPIMVNRKATFRNAKSTTDVLIKPAQSISYSSKEKLKLGSMGVDFIREISPAVLGCTLGLGTSTLVRRIWLGGPEHRAQ